MFLFKLYFCLTTPFGIYSFDISSLTMYISGFSERWFYIFPGHYAILAANYSQSTHKTANRVMIF